MVDPNLTHQQIKAETARIARRLRSFAKHRRALEQAIAVLGEDLDPTIWRQAFESSDPALTNNVLAVTGGYSTLINNYVEVVRACARLGGLMSGRRPNVEQCLEKLSQAGALSTAEARSVYALYGIEGRMEHLSPDLSPEEIREAIVRSREELPQLVEKALRWLSADGIEVS